VTRHADVAALLRDPRLGSEFPTEYHELALGKGAAASFLARIVLYRDAPAHTRLRKLFGQAFSPGALRRLDSRIEQVARGVVEPAVARGRFDAVLDIALPVPVLVVCELLGIPPDACDEVQPRAADLGGAFGTVVSPQARAAADDAVDWLRSFLTEILAQRRRKAGDDLLSRLMNADEDGGRLTEEEVVDNAVFAFFAGFETTVNLLAAGLLELGRRPQHQQLLRANTGLLPSAIEELLRFDPPIQGVARLVHEPLELHGRTLRRGRVLVLLLGSANRDERAFEDPDQLDLQRTPNPHVSFGGGPHLCMGAVLARKEAAAVFRIILERTHEWRLAGPAARRNGWIRAHASVPLQVSARAEGRP
jgi:cytochrome P450